jgi:hypothetical protein
VDIEADFLVNPLSYILGAVSFIGFFVLARKEVRLWLQGRIYRRSVAASKQSTALAIEQQEKQAGKLTPTLAGLILMGMAFSAAVYAANATVEIVEMRLWYSDFLFMLVIFSFTMLPGAMAGISAEAWIHASNSNQSTDLLNGLLTGMLVYLGFIFLIELTQMHVLFFLCGPVITLAVFRFAPG